MNASKRIFLKLSYDVYEKCIFYHFKFYSQTLTDMVKLCDLFTLKHVKIRKTHDFNQCYSKTQVLGGAKQSKKQNKKIIT